MFEMWKPINDYEGLYEISSYGRIKSLRGKKPKYLKPQNDSRGYLQIGLNKDGIRKNYKVHRLVALHFVEGYFDGAVVDHIDTDRKNNHYSNLRWVTHLENANNPLTLQHYSEYRKEHPVHITEEARMKAQATRKRKLENGEIKLKATKVRCVTTDKCFDSIKEASEYYNIRASEISACCKGKRKSCGRFNGVKLVWEYI